MYVCNVNIFYTRCYIFMCLYQNFCFNVYTLPLVDFQMTYASKFYEISTLILEKQIEIFNLT